MNVEAEASVAALVRSIRVTRGLTQEGLARELGVSFATVNGWENGRHRPIPLLEKKLQELAGGHAAPAPAAIEKPASNALPDRSDDELAAGSGWPLEGR